MIKKFRLGTWNLWRLTRLALGLFFAVVGIVRADYILFAAGVFLIVHAWVNSCAVCADDSCEILKDPPTGRARK